jgi:hypothetical protein
MVHILQGKTIFAQKYRTRTCKGGNSSNDVVSAFTNCKKPTHRQQQQNRVKIHSQKQQSTILRKNKLSA